MDDAAQAPGDEETAEPQGRLAEPPTPRELERIVEGLLFATREPVPALRISQAIDGASVRDVRGVLERLGERLRRARRGFELEEVAGGYRLVTAPDLAPCVRKLLRLGAHDRLTSAALETLAIIAYRQPILRADVEAIRGVACGGTLKLLLDRGLVRITGRADVLGRPLLYGTTKAFLEQFGLNTLADLPRADEFKPAERQARQSGGS